jgi:ABC-type antimicrobial peptide transport system permease subunit
VISSHSPATSLRGKGSYNSSGNTWLRKALIVFQFSISLFFIVGTLVIGDQVEFIRHADKGFEADNVVTTRFPSSTLDKPKAVTERVRQLSAFDDVMLQGTSPMGFAQMINSFEYKGKTPIVLGASMKSAGERYIPFYGIQLLAGRNLLENDSLKELVINRKMIDGLGFKKPQEAIGELLYYNDKPYPIVGVVENFNERSFHEPIGPCVMGNFETGIRALAMKFPKAESSAQRKQAMIKVESIFKQFYPDDMFEYHYIDEEIDWMHDSEEKTGRLMRVAMVVTIFISCMGIFGLSLFTTKIRTKEIGIRKVLGASVSTIVTLLSRDFAILIVIAFGVAAPISWYFAREWLQTFTYRIDLTIGVFIVAGSSALVIALICISFQTVRAALANPTDSLRAE